MPPPRSDNLVAFVIAAGAVSSDSLGDTPVQTFMQGMVDNEGGVTGRFNYGWSPKDTTKMSVQVRAVDGPVLSFRHV